MKSFTLQQLQLQLICNASRHEFLSLSNHMTAAHNLHPSSISTASFKAGNVLCAAVHHARLHRALCMTIGHTDSFTVPSILAEDGCDADPEITWFHTDGSAIFECDDSDGSADGTYSFERTFYAYATDACGNMGDTVSCVQVITAADQSAPEFGEYPPYEPVSCEDLTDPLDPTQSPLEVFDNCDGDLTISIEAWPLSGSCPGSWMRIWTATDDCGNVGIAEQYIALYDDTNPLITCPADTIVMLDQDIADDTTTTALGMAMATDNCSGWADITITYSDGSFQVDCEGDDSTPEGTMSFIRTFTASDFCDNSSSCDQHITLHVIHFHLGMWNRKLSVIS